MSIFSKITSTRFSIVAKFAFWSILLLLMAIYAVINTQINNQSETTHDYIYWQEQYKPIAGGLTNDAKVRESIEGTAPSIVQFTLQQFPFYIADGTNQQRVDRCQSCHVGVDNPLMTAENIIKQQSNGHDIVTAAQVPSYLNSHPKIRDIVYVLGAHPGMEGEAGLSGVAHGIAKVGTDGSSLSWSVATNSNPTAVDTDNFGDYKKLIDQHPYATYGCTTCHFGSGRDLQEIKAHGNTDFWLMPLMPSKYIDAACAQCHAQHNATDGTVSYLPEMKTVAKGQGLFKTNACWGCHKIDGFSKGNVGPELTFEGRIVTYHTVEHQLWDPRYKVNGCVMPYFFSKKQIVKTDGTTEPYYLDSYGDKKPLSSIAIAQVEPEIQESIATRHFVPDAANQDKVDALTCFVLAQTGMNYAESQNDRITRIAAFNKLTPPQVATTADEGKLLYDQSGCAACHYRGDPNHPRTPIGPPGVIGGYAGPNLSWEGSRHSVVWIKEHYKDPQAFVPKSIMPVFPFSDSQRQALSVYDASFIPIGGHAVSEHVDMSSEQLQTLKVIVPETRYMTR